MSEEAAAVVAEEAPAAEEAAAAEAPPAKEKKAPKAKKEKKPAKAKAAPTHPKYSVMITAAVKALKDRTGSSRQAILKYIVANYKVDEKKAATQVRLSLKRLAASGALKMAKEKGKGAGCYKIPDKNAPAAGAKKPAAKKAKKPAAKKAVKKAPKAKAAPKAAKPAAKKAKKPAAKAKKPAKKAK